MPSPDISLSIHIGTVFTSKRNYPSVVVQLGPSTNVEAHLITDLEKEILGGAGGIDVSEIQQIIGHWDHTRIINGLRRGVFHGLEPDFFQSVDETLKQESQKPPILLKR
jgi:hypothetical protein